MGVGVGTLSSSQDVELGRTMVDIVEEGRMGVVVCSVGEVVGEMLEGMMLSLEMEAEVEEAMGVAVEAMSGV